MEPITFPNLHLSFNVDPVAVTIGEKTIYWYGIIITFSIILAVFLAGRRLKANKKKSTSNNKFDFTFDDITDLCLWMIPIGIICARLYYCFFKWSYYSEHLGEIIKIWNGGMAIYGGIIGGFITGLVVCKVKKIRWLNLADFCFPYVALCQSIGRWGNFFNREAHGSITDSFLKMGIKENGDYIYVHPTFLYESICTFITFIILSILLKKRKFEGQVFFTYLILYGLARSIIEGLRTDSLYIANTSIRVSQLLSIALIIIGIIGYIINYKKYKRVKKS